MPMAGSPLNIVAERAFFGYKGGRSISIELPVWRLPPCGAEWRGGVPNPGRKKIAAPPATEPTALPQVPDLTDEIGGLERAGWPDDLKRDLFTGKWNIGFIMRDLHRMFRGEVKDAIASHGVSVSMWSYLWTLYQEDGLAQNELARRVRLVGPSVVAGLNQMERLGLVRRQRSKEDRRVIHIFLTPKANALRDDIMMAASKASAKALRFLSSSEINLLVGLLARVKQGLENGEERPLDDD